MNDRTKRAERREPSFESGRGGSRDDFDMRLSDDDRPVRGHRAPPRSEARQPPRRDKRSGGGGGRRRGRRGRSFLGGLFYWTLVLGLWCAIGLGGLIAYHAAQLPPINQLTVPKRPPNIAILAADGSLLANRGETGDLAAIAPTTLAQLAVYRALVGQIYPGRRVRALLVYTATLTRLEPEAAVLDALLAQLGAKGMDAA